MLFIQPVFCLFAMSSGADDDLLEKLNALRDSFYAKENKNALFKKTQKEMCARTVADQICVEDAIKTSFFAVTKEDFYLNYPLMKLFLNDNNYVRIIEELIEAIQRTICENGHAQIRIHINLNGFTVSAAERYKHVLQLFSRTCHERQIALTPYIENVVIYYKPAVMDSIVELLSFCIEAEIKTRLLLIPKEESEAALGDLFRKREEGPTSV